LKAKLTEISSNGTCDHQRILITSTGEMEVNVLVDFWGFAQRFMFYATDRAIQI